MSKFDLVVWKHGQKLTDYKHVVDPDAGNTTVCGFGYEEDKVSTSHWAQKKSLCPECQNQLEMTEEEIMGNETETENTQETKVEPLFDGQAVTLASLKQGVYLDLDVLPEEFDTEMDGEHVIITGLRHYKGDKTTVMLTFEKTGPLATKTDAVQGEEMLATAANPAAENAA